MRKQTRLAPVLPPRDDAGSLDMEKAAQDGCADHCEPTREGVTRRDVLVAVTAATAATVLGGCAVRIPIPR